MVIAAAVVSILFALVLIGSATGKLMRAKPTVENLTKAGVPDNWYPFLASAEIAGALGLLAGLKVAPLGVAAACGLILYFIGAIVAHLRVGDRMIMPPLFLGLIAVAALVLRVVAG